MSSTSAPPTDDTLRCARHPNVETALRCGRCETPICPKCLVATPVGARCPTCARVKRFAMMVKPRELALAIAYGVGAASIGAVILLYVPFLGLLGYAGLGYLVGTAVSIGANRKRARELGPVAIVCLALGFEIGTLVAVVLRAPGPVPIGPDLLLLPLTLLTRGLLLVGLLIGALLAWMRVR